MYDCITIGDATLDRFVILEEDQSYIHDSLTNPGNRNVQFELGQKIPVSSIITDLGGNAVNVATGLAVTGLSTAILSHMGVDEASQECLRILRKKSIDTQFVTQETGASINSSVILSLQGERVLFSHHTKHMYDFSIIPETQSIYISSLSQGYRESIDNLVARSRERGIKLFLNPGSYMLQHELSHTLSLLPFLEALFINKEEAQRISQSQSENITELFGILSHITSGCIIITDGKNGAYAYNKDILLYLPTRPSVLIEATGAGDAFASGFISGYLRDLSLEECLARGIINSSSVVQYIGASHGLLNNNTLHQLTSEEITRIQVL